MAKGYWIGNGVVHDAEGYKAYQAANAEPLARFGGRFLVRAGQQSIVEGDMFPRTVVIEFPSYADALACYESPEYQAAKALRSDISELRMVIVEGYDA